MILSERDRKFNIGCWLFLSLIMFFLSFRGCSKQNLNLNNFNKVDGVLVDKGVGFIQSSKSKIKCFYILLDNLPNQKLGIHVDYCKNKNFLDSISLGDSLTVFCIKKTYKNDYIDDELIQVQKKDEILYDKSEYESRYTGFIYLGFILGFIFFFISSAFWYRT